MPCWLLPLPIEKAFRNLGDTTLNDFPLTSDSSLQGIYFVSPAFKKVQGAKRRSFLWVSLLDEGRHVLSTEINCPGKIWLYDVGFDSNWHGLKFVSLTKRPGNRWTFVRDFWDYNIPSDSFTPWKTKISCINSTEHELEPLKTNISAGKCWSERLFSFWTLFSGHVHLCFFLGGGG